MPNWCANTVHIHGPASALADIAETLLESGKGLLSSTSPIPVSLLKANAGSDEVIYDVFFGDIPKYMWGWSNVKEAGINPEDPDARGKLIQYMVSSDRWENAKEKAELYKYNMDTHGHLTWYSWAVENWGTKWDVAHDEVCVDYEWCGRLELLHSEIWHGPEL